MPTPPTSLDAGRTPPPWSGHGTLALGCWAFGGSGWGAQDDADSLDAMAAALEEGVTHWDTALAYGNGRSEALCGRFLRGRRDQVCLATKGFPGRRPESILDSLRTSLRNLGTDRVDLYYLHWPLRGVDLRPYMELLEGERERGTIRAVGVSNFSVAQMRQVGEVGTIDAHQLGYNLFWRVPEADVIPYCVERGIPVVTYGSIAQGILTGKFPRDPVFPPGDARPQTVLFDPGVWPHLRAATEELKEVAAEAGRPLAHLAIQWCARRPGVAAVIVGARSGRQARENAAAMRGDVAPELMARVQAVGDRVRGVLPDEWNFFRFDP